MVIVMKRKKEEIQVMQKTVTYERYYELSKNDYQNEKKKTLKERRYLGDTENYNI